MINDQESFFAEVGLGNLDIKNISKYLIAAVISSVIRNTGEKALQP